MKIENVPEFNALELINMAEGDVLLVSDCYDEPALFMLICTGDNHLIDLSNGQIVTNSYREDFDFDSFHIGCTIQTSSENYTIRKHILNKDLTISLKAE